MKNLIVLAASLLFVSGTAASQHGHDHGKPDAKQIALTGEVVDLTCFMQHPQNATGRDHAKCAKACVNKGLPIGLLAEDGTAYLLVGTDHEPVVASVVDLLGKQSTLHGTVIDHHGMKAFALVSVGTESAVAYTCPMHPSARSDTPGKCAECGMKLEPVKK